MERSEFYCRKAFNVVAWSWLRVPTVNPKGRHWHSEQTKWPTYLRIMPNKVLVAKPHLFSTNQISDSTPIEHGPQLTGQEAGWGEEWAGCRKNYKYYSIIEAGMLYCQSECILIVMTHCLMSRLRVYQAPIKHTWYYSVIMSRTI